MERSSNNNTWRYYNYREAVKKIIDIRNMSIENSISKDKNIFLILSNTKDQINSFQYIIDHFSKIIIQDFSEVQSL